MSRGDVYLVAGFQVTPAFPSITLPRMDRLCLTATFHLYLVIREVQVSVLFVVLTDSLWIGVWHTCFFIAHVKIYEDWFHEIQLHG